MLSETVNRFVLLRSDIKYFVPINRDILSDETLEEISKDLRARNCKGDNDEAAMTLVSESLSARRCEHRSFDPLPGGVTRRVAFKL